MPGKKSDSSASAIDPDDAPELTAGWFADAETFVGNRFVKRGRGRPKAEVTKEQINVRLDRDVLATLRASGPGWQSRINGILREALALDDSTSPQTLPTQAEAVVRVREVITPNKGYALYVVLTDGQQFTYARDVRLGEIYDAVKAHDVTSAGDFVVRKAETDSTITRPPRTTGKSRSSVPR